MQIGDSGQGHRGKGREEAWGQPTPRKAAEGAAWWCVGPGETRVCGAALPSHGGTFPWTFLGCENGGAQADPSQLPRPSGRTEQERSLVIGQYEFGSISSDGALCGFC